MEKLIADVAGVKFDMEVALEQQLGAVNLPFPGMDKSTASVCIPYSKGQCPRGPYCPYRHIRGDRTIVCKHWLRGLCKKGDQCEFLHEYDMTKMPECYFYARFNACHNKECPFLHIDPESKIRDCPWYDRGFCRHGPTCRHRHVRRVLCMNYASGFCPDGPNCKFMHPRFELPPMPEDIKPGGKKSVIVCHYCGESGHKALQCPKMPCEAREVLMRPHDVLPSHGGGYGSHGGGGDHRGGMGGGYHHEHRGRDRGERGPPRPLEEVTCFKCGDKGHYANKCPKGHLAFLSQGGGGPRR